MLSAQELSAEIAALQQEQERLRSALEARGAEKRGLAAELRRLKASVVEKREPDDDGKDDRKDDSEAGGGGALFDRATQRRLSMTRSFTQLRADVAASEQQPSATATGGSSRSSVIN